MTAKEYLQQLYRLKERVERQKDKLATLKSMLTSIRSPVTSDEKVIGENTSGASFEKIVEKIEENEIELNNLIDNFLYMHDKITGELEELNNNTHEELLYKKYVQFKSLETIAKEMNYSYNWIRHSHGYALLEFENKILKVSTQKHTKAHLNVL